MIQTSVLEKWGRTLSASVLVLAGAILVGCSGDHEHEPHDHGHETEGHGHAHVAPHGGALGMLGNHLFQLEVVASADDGTIGLYVLDGEAERFVRVAQEVIVGQAVAGERRWDLQFESVANAATGETRGDSAYFVAEADGLAEQERFDLLIEKLEIRGNVFEGIEIPFPEGKH